MEDDNPAPRPFRRAAKIDVVFVHDVAISSVAPLVEPVVAVKPLSCTLVAPVVSATTLTLLVAPVLKT